MWGMLECHICNTTWRGGGGDRESRVKRRAKMDVISGGGMNR